MSSQASATAGISAREAEVLTLVAQHRSNAEIGARLFISVRTVGMIGDAVAAALGSVSSRAAGWTSRSWPPWRIAMPCWC